MGTATELPLLVSMEEHNLVVWIAFLNEPLVYEVQRLLDTAENQEDVVEYCVTRLKNLLSSCVNLFDVIVYITVSSI